MLHVYLTGLALCYCHVLFLNALLNINSKVAHGTILNKKIGCTTVGLLSKNYKSFFIEHCLHCILNGIYSIHIKLFVFVLYLYLYFYIFVSKTHNNSYLCKIIILAFLYTSMKIISFIQTIHSIFSKK